MLIAIILGLAVIIAVVLIALRVQPDNYTVQRTGTIAAPPSVVFNADRLVRLVAAHPSERVRAYWAAVATWLKTDRRLARLAGAYEGAPLDLLPTGTEFQVKRRGEDERFTGSKLRVPNGTLRDRTTSLSSVAAPS